MIDACTLAGGRVGREVQKRLAPGPKAIAPSASCRAIDGFLVFMTLWGALSDSECFQSPVCDYYKISASLKLSTAPLSQP